MKKVLNKRSKIMNKLMCALLAICIFCNLPVQAQSTDSLEKLRADTQESFNRVLFDIQAIKKILDAQLIINNGQTLEISDLTEKADTQAGFNGVASDVQQLKILSGTNITLDNLRDDLIKDLIQRVKQLEKRRKHRALKDLVTE